MSRVLLVCPERLGPGLPAGVGIRFLEFARVLSSDGHDVTVLSVDGADVPRCRSLMTSPETLRDASAAADVVVVQGHVANDLFAHGAPRPTVVDLYDPYLVENFHYFAERGREVFDHDHATLMRSIARGDLFLCASESQRLFFLGVLAAARRLNPLVYETDHAGRSLVAIAPFGVPPPRDVPDKAIDSPTLLFGGIYDWYDPILAIEAVAEARRHVPGLSLTFTRHPNAAQHGEGLAAKAERFVEERGFSAFVRFEPWVPYGERVPFYDRFNAAILTFPSSLETDLAMRTRVLDYLWAGLPVITSPGRGTDELVERYRAGAIVHEQASSAFAFAIREAFSNAASLRGMMDGAASFASDFQWERTLAPLREFCQAPREDPARRAFAEGRQPESGRDVSLLRRIRRRIGRRL
jgi:glycosyltransferase involved in cell wall biosynthesis